MRVMNRKHSTRGSAAAKVRPVRAWPEEVVIPTYLPATPDPNPMFLEKRVYQGSSGRIYPLPFTGRIAEKPVERTWQVIWLENQYLRIMILPELGGRVHAALDKTNGYDLVYRQHVIKPALVGLAGPWVSGGIEFNWPQHHRPATFLPVATRIEAHPDGAVTVWCSDHDPLTRLKGMHGLCLRPGSACLEIRARVSNRTAVTQTFLWWTNIGVRVHEGYQSFFPPDVHHVADHARRATSTFPLCTGTWYGVNYGARPAAGLPEAEVPPDFIPPHCFERNGSSAVSPAPAPEPAPPPGTAAANGKAASYFPFNHQKSRLPSYEPNDLSWYANIPTPCSYMAVDSTGDFLGGYDHLARAGLVHVADHHIAPGKKQWTWGNHPFGYAWDRNLTDTDGPYIELMAGVFTDNQPDFSFLQPGETRQWSQFLYPIQKIGPVCQANPEAVLSLRRQGNAWHLGLAVTRHQPVVTLRLTAAGRSGKPAGPGQPFFTHSAEVSPGSPLQLEIPCPDDVPASGLRVTILGAEGQELLTYHEEESGAAHKPQPPPAAAPPLPEAVAGNDELYLIGLHLEQYRHATRFSTAYWQEALRRDPGDSRCHTALGRWHLQRGEFQIAESHFRAGLERLLWRNQNPYDGEAFYYLGLCLRYQLDAEGGTPPAPMSWSEIPRFREAYASFSKACWNQPWIAASSFALAELDCRRHDWGAALAHLDRVNQDDMRASLLRALVLRQSGDEAAARQQLGDNLRHDPLDAGSLYLLENTTPPDAQTALDLAHDFARSGFYREAIRLLSGLPWTTGEPADVSALPTQSWGTRPLLHYTLAWLRERCGENDQARKHRQVARQIRPDHCFPARLEEIPILESARRADAADARAPYYLGNLLYDRRRHQEAIRLWEASVALDPAFATPWRNLGLGYFNILRQPADAARAYQKARLLHPGDGRLLYESDQLAKRLGEAPADRLRELARHRDLVLQRDDLSVELATLHNLTGQPEKALELLTGRRFQPWEGGEGQALAQFARAKILSGRAAMGRGDYAQARRLFTAALEPPDNLGETWHLLANRSDIYFWLGCASAGLQDRDSAARYWQRAAGQTAGFREMAVQSFSEMTFFASLSCQAAGNPDTARELFQSLLAYARELQGQPAGIDYFATSLPNLLLFEEDPDFRQRTLGLFMEAQARLGLGEAEPAHRLLHQVLQRDPCHALATEWITLGPPAAPIALTEPGAGLTEEPPATRRRP